MDLKSLYSDFVCKRGTAASSEALDAILSRLVAAAPEEPAEEPTPAETPVSEHSNHKRGK